MKLIHYILFLPPTFLFGYYIKRKLSRLFPNQNLDRWQNRLYYLLILSVFLISVLTLSYFAVFFFYVVLLYVVFDVTQIFFKKLNLKKLRTFLHKIYLKGITVWVLAAIITFYGMYIASHPDINFYEFDIKKQTPEIKIVMLSDLHLGTGSTETTIDSIVEEVDKQKADLFVLVGDIFDERTPEELKEYAYESFGKVVVEEGTFFVEGNHDLLTKETRVLWTEHNVNVLEDKVKLINNQYYLVGRKDKSVSRMKLENLLSNIDSTKPIIVLDHQPTDEKKTASLGVDLQLSGHTHYGQLFPGGLFVKHGLKKIDDYNLLISNGYGTWGIPIRTSGKSELLVVKIK